MIPLADPLPLPAPPGLLWALLQLTFLLHLVAMNVVLGGSILALHWRFSRREEDAAAPRVAPRLLREGAPGGDRRHGDARRRPAPLPAGALRPALLHELDPHGLVLARDRPARDPRVLRGLPPRLPGRRRSAAGRAGWPPSWRSSSPRSPSSRCRTRRAPCARTRSSRPTVPTAAASSSTSATPRFWPRYLHVLLGAVAVAALGVALYGVLRRAREPQLAAWAIRRGTTVFGVATAANVFVGLLFLLAQPSAILIRLVGGDAWAMALLALGILLGVAAAGLALLALGAKDAVRATWAQLGSLAATLVVMVLLRDQVRQLALRDAGFERPAPGGRPVGAVRRLRRPARGRGGHDRLDGPRARPPRGAPPSPSSPRSAERRSRRRRARRSPRSDASRARSPRPGSRRRSSPRRSAACSCGSSRPAASRGRLPSARRKRRPGPPSTSGSSRTTSGGSACGAATRRTSRTRTSAGSWSRSTDCPPRRGRRPSTGSSARGRPRGPAVPQARRRERDVPHLPRRKGEDPRRAGDRRPGVPPTTMRPASRSATCAVRSASGCRSPDGPLKARDGARTDLHAERDTPQTRARDETTFFHCSSSPPWPRPRARTRLHPPPAALPLKGTIVESTWRTARSRSPRDIPGFMPA